MHFTCVWQATTYSSPILNTSCKFYLSHLFILFFYSINWIVSSNTATSPTKPLEKLPPHWSSLSDPCPWGLIASLLLHRPNQGYSPICAPASSPSPLWPPPYPTLVSNFIIIFQLRLNELLSCAPNLTLPGSGLFSYFPPTIGSFFLLAGSLPAAHKYIGSPLS